MTAIVNRPSPFAAMGAAFLRGLANVDVTLVVDGVAAEDPVRGILRQMREIDMMPESGVSVEGVTHTLAIEAIAAAGLESDRDSVVIDAVAYAIKGLADDGRAMVTLFLSGDI